MIIIKLALRNLLGAGLRTWLNVIVLSFSFVVIIWLKGLLDGWDRQAKNDMISWELGGGQYWQTNYDPNDPFTLNDSHDKIPEKWKELISAGEMTPILIAQGTLYPFGRMQSVLIKGIDPGQSILSLPTAVLKSDTEEIRAIIGSAMAGSTRLKKGDAVTLRWRDKHGAFDATEIIIADIFETNVPTVDGGQIWIPVEQLRKMMLLPDESTLMVRRISNTQIPDSEGWKFQSQKLLLEDIDKIVKAKTTSSVVLWAILLMLAMLAIFDTQVLSIFRRQKEIGTYIALGMTRKQVVTLFTLEGALHAVLAAILGAIYGIPFLAYQSVKGIALPMKSSDYGLAMADKLYPVYGLGLIISTIMIVFLTTTLVSYWPSRKISKMKPSEALRGKIQ
jgi:ABC-type lipoprotein release transport system permease subunit